MKKNKREWYSKLLAKLKRIESGELSLTDYISEVQEKLRQPIVSSSALPDGFKVYRCTDCQEWNMLRDNGEIRVGECWNCEHPIWNPSN